MNYEIVDWMFSVGAVVQTSLVQSYETGAMINLKLCCFPESETYDTKRQKQQPVVTWAFSQCQVFDIC